MEQEVIAFWKYDRYPYCLWGLVDKFKDDRVYINSYLGWFRPFLVVEKEYGNKLITQLMQLEYCRIEDMEKVKQEFEERLDQLIKIPGVNT